jgi:translation elongation factor EF-1alpha
MKIEKRTAVAVGMVALVATVLLVTGIGRARAANAPERYLHVRVDGGSDGEKVNVNVPLALAEQVLPAINHGQLHSGKVKVDLGKINTGDVDVKAILQAVRNSPDNEFVTVQQADQDVRVAKSGDNIVVHVRSKEGKDKESEKVDVTVPLSIVEAVLKNNADNEIDLNAVLHALENTGDNFVINVKSAEQNVHVWVDGKNDSN